jgi:dolichol kinase
VEGSLSVLIVSIVLSAAFFGGYHYLPLAPSLLSSLLLSAVVVFVEAASPHGADNLTIQVAASGLASLFVHLWG